MREKEKCKGGGNRKLPTLGKEGKVISGLLFLETDRPAAATLEW